jgi:tetratricopeptide (TPR) repeat protein
MKRILILLLVLGCGAAFAQKQAKPNINKAMKAWEDGKLAEAKDIIDQATTYEKTKDDANTWFYRGLIYSTLDTTKNEAFKSLDPNALKVAMASFAKADSMKKGSKEFVYLSPATMQTVLKDNHMENLANFYLQEGINKFQEEQDNVGSLENLRKSRMVFEKGLKTYRNDTLNYYVTGLVAQQSDSVDLALENITKYNAKGGKSKDAYLILYQIYSTGPKADKEKALEVLREARQKFPNITDFARYEIGMLIDMNKIDEAKVGLEEAIKNEPQNKDLQFLLGYTYNETKDYVNARKHFEEAAKLDPNFFNAHYYLAVTYLGDVDKITKELNATGNTAADSKKRSALVQQRVKASEVAIPFLQKVEKMKAPDKEMEIDVLQKLQLMYYYTADDKNSAIVEKKLKALGVTD